MSDDNNIFKLPDGSSIIKNADGKIRAHIPSKKVPSNIIAFPARLKSPKDTEEPVISYEDAKFKYQSILDAKNDRETDSIFIVEEDLEREFIISPLFVNHDLIAKDYNQSVAYNRDQAGIVSDSEGEPLGILLRFEDEVFVETNPLGETVHIASLEVEPWVPNIDRGRGIEYRFLLQELAKPSIINTGELDFFDVKISVPEDNAALAVELINDGREVSPKGDNFNVFEKRIPATKQ